MNDRTTWPEGYGRRILEEVDSTLSEAARIASDLAGPDLTGPEWILARRQTAGRGRRGRRWVEPEGNFAATLVLRPSGAVGVAALRSFVAALALFDACGAVSGRSQGFALKWPNDVLLNGGKLAGILLESAGQGGAVSYLSIGIGVNLVAAPAVADAAFRPVSLLSETGASVDPETFLTFLAIAYARREAQFVADGFAPIREAWLARAAGLGRGITARTGNQTVSGIFETVDDTGNLVLSTDRGRVCIAAADVFFQGGVTHAFGD